MKYEGVNFRNFWSICPGMPQGSGVSETTKLETHVRMSAVTPLLTFANLIVLSGSQTKHPILAQSVNRFFRYGKVVRTRARADAPHL